MSVINIHEIDALGISKDKRGFVLMLTDHMEWLDEYQHLLLLQDKINAYIAFLEMEQYNEIYPQSQFYYCIIEIHFKYKPTPNVKHFLQVVQKQISELELGIKCSIRMME